MKLSASDIVKLAVSIIVSFSAGIIGSFYTGTALESWYKNLQKPSFAPPNWVFAPAWTVLYLLMGFAVFLVWRESLRKREVRIALAVFIIQLVLNGFWSYVFFGLRNPLAAFFVIVVLWVAILITIFRFYKVSKVSALLLIPYILWVSFAGALNYSIFQLNQ